jgi:hypothetical protein
LPARHFAALAGALRHILLNAAGSFIHRLLNL